MNRRKVNEINIFNDFSLYIRTFINLETIKSNY